jgi:hypothetical protein
VQFMIFNLIKFLLSYGLVIVDVKYIGLLLHDSISLFC